MTSRFESINNNIFSPSKPIQQLSGDNSNPFILNIPSLLTTKLTPLSVEASIPLPHQNENENNVHPEENSKEQEQTNAQQQQGEQVHEEVPPSKKYTIETDSSSLIKLPSGYSTDIFKEKQIIDYINGKNGEKWETKYESDKITVKQIFVSHITLLIIYIYIYVYSTIRTVLL